MSTSEESLWSGVKGMIGRRRLTLGGHWSFNLRHDPKRLPFVLARYKLAAKMACKGAKVLELGCSEGIGTPILAEFAASYTGVDMDSEAVEAAQQNFAAPNRTFLTDDFLGKTFGSFDAVVSLDVVEHIVPELEDHYFDTVAMNLTETGIAVVGTPSKTSEAYASPMSRAGHVNVFTAEHLMQAMRRVFHNVFPFGINDEVVHTGYAPMCHYVVCVGCNKAATGGRGA
ncbi:MAG: methyltransferase domain-containing protein [Phycisphaeraceae bacterium]